MAEMGRSPDNPDSPDAPAFDDDPGTAPGPDAQVDNPQDPATPQQEPGEGDNPTPADSDDAVDWSSLDDDLAARASTITLPQYEQEMTAAQNSADAARIADVQKRYDQERVRLAQEQNE